MWFGGAKYNTGWWPDVAMGLKWSWWYEVSPYIRACLRDEAFYDINSCMRSRAGKGVTHSSGENKIDRLCLPIVGS